MCQNLAGVECGEKYKQINKSARCKYKIQNAKICTMIKKLRE